MDKHRDAADTQKVIEEKGRRCLALAGDISYPDFCKTVVKETLKEFKKIDVLVNNSAQQYLTKSFEEIMQEQLIRTFEINVFSCFYLFKAALPQLKKGSTIINTTSITAYKGSDHLIDYSATKSAIVSLTCSYQKIWRLKDIRVNGVAPGPIWTPLIPASFTAKQVQEFGSSVPMKRAGEPKEVAPAYAFLASDDSSYMSGQVLHPNGGVIVNG